MALLERRLRVGVDPVRQVDDLVARGLDGGGDAGLGVGERVGRAGGGQRGHAVLLGDVRTCGARSRANDSAASAPSALGGEGRLGDDDEGDHEQRDRQLEQALQPQDDEDGDDDADPRRAPDRPQPVALVGDPAMPAEDRQPQDRDRGSARRRGPMSAAPTNPALGSTTGSRVVTTSPTRTQTTAAAPKKARLVSPVARLP